MRKLIAIVVCIGLAFLVCSAIKRGLADRAALSAMMIMEEEPALSRDTASEYAKALAFLERAIRLNSRKASYHREMGDLYLKYLSYAVGLDLAGEEGLVEVGDRKLDAPQFLMLAKDEFLRAEELEPTGPVAHLRVGAINQILSSSFGGEGLTSQARSEFLKARSLWPDSPYYNYVAGLFLVENGERQEALPYFQRAIHGRSQMAYSIIVALGDSGMKADDIKRFLPRDARVYLDLAVYLLEEGGPKGADAVYREAMAIRPLDDGERSYYVSELIRARQFDRAVELLNKILDKNPGDHRVYSSLGEVYMQLKDWDLAYENYGIALKNCPWTSAFKRQRSKYYTKRGWTSINQKRFVRAIEDMTGAQSADPSNSEAYFGEALCYIHLNKELEKAEEKLAKAIALNPGPSQYYCRLAEVAAALGNHDKAVDLLKESVSREPGKPELYLALAETYLEMGRMEDAKKHSARALELSPRDSGIRKRALEILGVE